MKKRKEEYPVVKENVFDDEYLILFTGPRTGRVVSTGDRSGLTAGLVGSESSNWAEEYFRERPDLDPASYPPPAVDD